MVLQDRKIPILAGINDVPSTDGQPNHPNDSLLCEKYNALIDELVVLEEDVIIDRDNFATLQDEFTTKFGFHDSLQQPQIIGVLDELGSYNLYAEFIKKPEESWNYVGIFSETFDISLAGVQQNLGDLSFSFTIGLQDKLIFNGNLPSTADLSLVISAVTNNTVQYPVLFVCTANWQNQLNYTSGGGGS